MFCPYCGRGEFEKQDKCPFCGKELQNIGEESGYECSRCKKDATEDADYCWFCGEILEAGDDVSEDINAGKRSLPETSFKVLQKYGRFLKGYGWFLIILGLIVILVFILQWLFSGLGEMYLSLLLYRCFIGFMLVIAGIPYIVLGEAVSCFVAMEHNTKQTTLLLGKILAKLNEKK